MDIVNGDRCLFDQASSWFSNYTLMKDGSLAVKKKIASIQQTTIAKNAT